MKCLVMEELLTVLISVFCAVSVYGEHLCRTAKPPTWPQTYSVRGVITIPYAELREPFLTYFDGTVGSSRTDYYGDMVKTYQMSTRGRYGSMIKLAPVTTETELNVVSCLQVNGTKGNKITPQSVLPVLANFECVGKELIDGVETEKWGLVIPEEDKISKYAMWLKWEKVNDIKGKPEPVPVRYEMKGYNTLLGSHYDHYYLSYDMFSSEAPSPSVWEIGHNLTCGGFPGPGILSTGSFNPMKEFISNYDDHIEHAWTEYKQKYNKEYRTAEHMKRRRTFRDNHRYVHSINRAGLGFQLKLNQFADWSHEELRLLHGRYYTVANNNASAFPYTHAEIKRKAKEIPQDFDWRLYGAVNPVKDQSICGSCWSFGTTGAVEGAYFVKTGLLISLSEQALIDCSWGYGNNGCDGGEDFRSYQWIMKHGGLPLEGDYGQYLGNDGYCHADKVQLVAPITGYVNVTANDESALRLAIFKHGPISISIDASPRSFTFYSNGVYSDPVCKNRLEDLDHSVLAVGYGTLQGKSYWLVKNSWSNMWGNDGYILIAAENNICGVMSTPTYVTM